jgi:hypothetical protein
MNKQDLKTINKTQRNKNHFFKKDLQKSLTEFYKLLINKKLNIYFVKDFSFGLVAVFSRFFEMLISKFLMQTIN